MVRKPGPGRTRNSSPPRGRQISSEQLALVHTARRQCNMADDSYRQMLQDVAGVTSAKDLTPNGLAAVLSRFKVIGFVHRPKNGAGTAWKPAPRFGQRAGMATDAQIAMICAKWAEWSGRNDATGLDRWLENSFGVSSLRFLNAHTAAMAIEGMKQMTARKAVAPRDTQAGTGDLNER